MDCQSPRSTLPDRLSHIRGDRDREDRSDNHSFVQRRLHYKIPMKFSRWRFKFNPAKTFLETEWGSPKLRAEPLHLSANRLISIPHAGVCLCVSLRACVYVHDRLSSHHDPQHPRFMANLSVGLLIDESRWLLR